MNDDTSFLKLSAVRAGPTAALSYQLPPYPENGFPILQTSALLPQALGGCHLPPYTFQLPP